MMNVPKLLEISAHPQQVSICRCNYFSSSFSTTLFMNFPIAASDSLEVSSERTPQESGVRSETVSEEESCDEELDEFAVDDEKLR